MLLMLLLLWRYEMGTITTRRIMLATGLRLEDRVHRRSQALSVDKMATNRSRQALYLLYT
jgi:hypothetical protein